MKSSYCVLIVWFLCFVSLGRAQLKDGDACILDDGQKGECEPMDACEAPPEVIACGDEPSNPCISPSICCRKLISRVDKNTIAGRKCHEYAKSVFKEGPSLTIGGMKTNDSLCFSNQDQLVVGGEKAKYKEFPHMVILGYGPDPNHKLWLCGGSLISEQFVLTAAHCVKIYPYKFKGDVKWVRLGVLNLQDPADGKNIIPVSERIPHPLYNNKESYNDIALLKLNSAVIFSPTIRPACLNTILGNPLKKSNATVTGWGLTKAGNAKGSDDLLKVDLQFRPNAECNDTFQDQIKNIDSKLKMGILQDSMICAGDPFKKKDTCQGDSGGPLQIRLDSPPDPYCMYTIVGVTSFGVEECGSPGKPAVFTRVSNYIPWIEKTVWPDE